jgi:HEAT repeat protein
MALASIARDKGKSETARNNAVYWIGNSKVPNRVTLLDEIYKTSLDSEKLRVQVAFALRRTREPSAVGVLANIAKTDPSIAVRRQAVRYLGEIETPEAVAALENLLKK